MVTMSLTEFNQNPSLATRLADLGEVIVERRGKPAYRINRVIETNNPLQSLIDRGLATPATRTGPGAVVALNSKDLGLDSTGLLMAERDPHAY